LVVAFLLLTILIVAVSRFILHRWYWTPEKPRLLRGAGIWTNSERHEILTLCNVVWISLVVTILEDHDTFVDSERQTECVELVVEFELSRSWIHFAQMVWDTTKAPLPEGK
jgi:hypothetical protein